MVLVTPNIPNNTIFAMSQTTELYYLLCYFQNIEFENYHRRRYEEVEAKRIEAEAKYIEAEAKYIDAVAERDSVIESLKAEIEQLKAGK